MNQTAHPSSYRDPSGFVFEWEGKIYRQVNQVFKDDFDHFISSGCYNKLVDKGWLIPHQDTEGNLTGSADHYRTILPEQLGLVTYPYEWSFNMLKDAALLTLQLVKEAISYQLILKDATPYNIQWHQGRLVFIDTLSFERYHETEPWIAYRQFCENFLAPLLLMHYNKVPLQPLQLAYPEGIPLDIASRLLPYKSRFSLYTYLHVHLHAKVSGQQKNNRQGKQVFSKQKLLNLISSLESLITKLTIPYKQSTWSEYYNEAATRDNYLTEKKSIIGQWLDRLQHIKTVADLGANDGEFSKLAADKNFSVIAADFDPWCIDNLYRQVRSSGINNIQPLILDLSNPSPSTGVNNEERMAFMRRCKADLVMALAVIHHLAIGKNIPLEKAAAFFRTVGQYLIIEFVPKNDEKVEWMLQHKKDIYSTYNEQEFILAFEQYFIIEDKRKVGNTSRTLFLMKQK